jgi:MFS family permease
VSGLCWGYVTDLTGRRAALFWASLLTVFAAILQATAQNPAMFVIARILIGFGAGASGISATIFMDETLPGGWKAQGLGLYNDCYYIGVTIPFLARPNHQN